MIVKRARGPKPTREERCPLCKPDAASGKSPLLEVVSQVRGKSVVIEQCDGVYETWAFRCPDTSCGYVRTDGILRQLALEEAA